MSEQKDIAELRRRLFTDAADGGAFYATVTTVNESARTCTVEADEVPYDDVLLYAVADDSKKGFCFIPTVGSTVLAARLGGSNELCVAMFSEVDKALLTIGEKVTAAMDAKGLTLDADQITLNGGSLGGLIKIQALTNKINELVEAFNGHTHTIITGGVAVTGSPSAQANAAPITVPAVTAKHKKVAVADYENDKITH